MMSVTLRGKPRQGSPLCNKLIACAVLAAGAVSAAAAKDVWVDCANYGKSGLDGKSVETAYGTIQDAVNAASANDVIKVRPGIYNQGEHPASKFGRSRVYIANKVLTIEATSSDPSDTHIVGKWDSNPDATVGYGIGTTDGCRCIVVRQSVGTVIKGFTIRDGASQYVSPSTDGGASSAGGILALNGSDAYNPGSAYAVNCVFTHCTGIRGGALRGATAVRCVFTENYGWNSGDVGRQVVLVNCLLTRNGDKARGRLLVYDSSTVINCTVVNNGGRLTNVSAYNTIAMNNTYGSNGEQNSSGCAVYNYMERYDGANPNFASASELSTCHTNAPIYQFVAPAYDDYRVRKGSLAATAGDAKWLASGEVVTLPEGINPYLDIDGNPISTTGSICAGSSQTVTETSGGCIEFEDREAFLFDGHLNRGKQVYAFASSSTPTSFVFQAAQKGNPHIYSFFTDNDKILFPAMDDKAAMMPFAEADSVRTVSVYKPLRTLYVDVATGEDSPRTGLTDADPYETIQAALNAISNDDRTLVEVAAGDYRKGEKTTGGLRTRVASARYVRVIGKGADKSVIWGEAPTTAGGHDGMRCAAFSVTSALQGFTLRDGYAGTDKTYDGGKTTDAQYQRGGGFYGLTSQENTNAHVLDCVITNCWAYRGGAAYAGMFERCHIVDCTAGNGVCRYTRMFSCIVDHLTPASGFTGGNNYYGALFNCTLVGRSTSEYVIAPSSGPLTNCLVLTTKELGKSMVADGSIAWEVSSCAATGVSNTNPYLANVTTDTYRPTSVSPALGYGAAWNAYKVNLLDYAGEAFRFATNGKMTAGAYQEPVPAVAVGSAAFGTLTPSDYVGCDPDGLFRLTYAETRKRHLLGYSVNGVFTNAPGTATTAFALTEAEIAAGVQIDPVFSTNWYVNANTDLAKGIVGSDANDGFTPETPWETLQYSMTNSVVQNHDTIHAAPGVYAKGEDSCHRRVQMRAYVTLVGDEGPEKTFIVGELADPSGATLSERMGAEDAGAVACVYFPYNYSHLKGFTLTGGSTANKNTETLNNCGGAVYMASAAEKGVSSVTDCIISNNCSGRAACYKGKYVNCRILGNYGLWNTPATRQSRLVNCLVDGNVGATTLQGVSLVNCVIGPNNLAADGTTEESTSYSSSGLTNCVLLGKSAGSECTASHCFIRSDRVGSLLKMTDCDTSCETLAEMGFGDDYRPLSAAAPVVDFGTRELASDHTVAVDLGGGQRVYNAKIDIGPYEYDWCSVYAKTLGGGVTVTAASPEVTNATASVVLPAGATLALDWPNAYGKPKRSSFTADVAAETALEIVRDDEVWQPVSSGVTHVKYRSSETDESFAFCATGLGSVALSDFVRANGLLMLVR